MSGCILLLHFFSRIRMEQLMSISQEETENLRQREIAGELWEFCGQSFQVASLLPTQGTECSLCGRAAKSVLELRPGVRQA